MTDSAKPAAADRALELLRACGRFFQEKIGWSRIAPVLSIAIIAVAMVMLYHLLQDIDTDKVIAAIRNTPAHNVILAAIFVAAGYFTLTFYDLFALRTIGRNDVPYRVAALAGFTSYAVGHNIGASVFSAAAVRYRIYSAWGLSAAEVAKLCFIAGLTFWLGNAAVLGIGISYVPRAASAINQLPSWLNRAIAIATIAVLYSYVVWVWRGSREVGLGQWRIRLPGGPLTLLQIGIGIVDLTCCSLAMYVLLPGETHIGFVTLAVIFISATLLGFASHAPGGIGVFDAAMLAAVSQMDREQVLAGILLFRLLYYIAPFTLALIILGSRELMLGIYRPRPAPLAESSDNMAARQKEPDGKG